MSEETGHDILYPLSMFRMTREIPSLSFEVIEGSEIPDPYRDLLFHDGDMTSRLEHFHGGAIYVDKLHSSSDGRAYFREVTLRREKDSCPVEYGAIEISLSALPTDAAELVLEAKRPLGGILNHYRISSEWALIEFPVNSEGVLHEFRMILQLAVRVLCWDKF